MPNTNERPDSATRQVTSDENKTNQSKEIEKRMEELKMRLQVEKASELERQKEILVKNYEVELHRILHQKEKELKEARSETKRIKEDLTLQVRDAERRMLRTPPVGKEGVSRKLVTEVVELKGVKRRLEEALGDVMDSDKRKACELRKLHDEHVAELGRFKREAESEIRKLLSELKIKDRIIRQLKRELWIANERQEKSFSQCQPQSQNKLKTGSQDNGNEKASITHNVISKCESSVNNALHLNKRNPNKRKYVSNSTQSSDVEDKQSHYADSPDGKRKERKILKTGQVSETMYKRLYKEHLELQRSFALLRQMITDPRGERGKCKNVVSLADENQKLEQISQHLKNKIQKLRNELKESRDQNELLEFCVLEMENQGKANLVPKLVDRGVQASLMPKLTEQGVNIVTNNKHSSVLSESTEFDALVEAYPHQELNVVKSIEIRKKLKGIYSLQGTNNFNKQTLIQAASHIKAAFTAISNLQNVVTSLTEKVEAVKKEKESHVCCSPEMKENYEQCRKHLEETKNRLLEVSEQLASMQRREATLSHLEHINRRFKEHLQVVLQDFQVLLSGCADAQETDVQNLREKINELYKIEKEVMSQAEKAGIPQASPNPLEVVKEVNVTSSKSIENSSCSTLDSNVDVKKDNLQIVEELKLELQKQELTTEEYVRQQKKLTKNCDELSTKLTEYEAIKYDLTQKIIMLEKSEQDLVEKNLKLYIDYVSAKEEVQKLLVELESRQVVSLPNSPLEMRSIVSVECSDVQRTLSEESGTMTSEDEGLGEESRRGDSTGPSSLADLQESEEDLLTHTSDFESEATDEHKSGLETSHSDLMGIELSKLAFVEECEKVKFKWKKEVAELKDKEMKLVKQLKYSQMQVSELQENIKVKEEQVRQLLEGSCLLGHNRHCEEELQQIIKNMQMDLIKLEEKLSLTERNKNLLKEQVLELEEAENDARLVGQTLQEKLNLAVEQGNSIQRELNECKSHLQESSNQIQSHNATEVELRSQITYMEFLISKYEDHIRELEASKVKLQQKVFCLEQLLQSAEALTGDLDQQVTNGREDKKSDSHFGNKDSNDTNKISDLSGSLSTTAAFVPQSLQEKLPLCQDILQNNSHPIKSNIFLPLISKAVSSYTDKISDSKCNSTKSLHSNILPPYVCKTLFSGASLIQKELVQRLNILEKDDQTLREQLHQMDGMNLELWKKLHNLENHVGQCMKDSISELNEPNVASFSDSRENCVTSHESVNILSCNEGTTFKSLCQETESETKDRNLISNSSQSILQRVLSLETSEHLLKDRLLQLENINHEFEKELEIRENLYKEKESQQRKWLEVENALQETIRSLENEKSNLLNNVLRLEEEKLVLHKNIENLQMELETLKSNYSQAVKELEIHRSKALNELEEKQSSYGAPKDEKETISVALEQLVVNASSSTLEINLEKYNLLTGELEMLKRDHSSLKQSATMHKDGIEVIIKDFEEQFIAITNLQKSKEEKLKLEIESLVTKENEYNLQIIEMLQKQTALENELILKETEFDQVKKQFSEQMKLLEEEHHVVEAELKWKMKEMEENAAITIKALTEERGRLENDLQADLSDLHIKEESYKLRITELEGCIENLRKEVNQIADINSESNNEKLEPQSENKLFLQKIEELQKNEKQMKTKLTEMEKKEEAYKETLEHAEKIISTLEHSYSDKIEELESSERALKLRVSQLEEVENRLRCTLHNEKRTSEIRKASDLIEELMEGEIREIALRERIKELESNQKTLLEKLQEMERSKRYLQEELGDHDEMIRTIEKLQQQQEMLKRELLTVQQSENALQETLNHADDILIQREDELRQNLVHVEDEKNELEETTMQLRKQVKELQTVIEASQYGKVSPIGEHLYETFSNCDSEEEFQQSDESFYLPERTNGDVEKVKELERIGNELRQEVTHLKQSLSAANVHLIDLDNVNRSQQMTISRLEEVNSVLQEQIKSSQNLESKCKLLEQLCNDQEREKVELQQNLKELEEKQKCREDRKDISSELQEQKWLETKLQEKCEPCDIQMDATNITKKCEVETLAQLCNTVLRNAKIPSNLDFNVFGKKENECSTKEFIVEQINALSDIENDIVVNMNMSESLRNSSELWSAIPGTVSLDDLTTGLEAQLELEQCVKRAMAVMENEMMQKEASKIPASSISGNSNETLHDSSTLSSTTVLPSIDNVPSISNNLKGTITKCKTKILDVSELQQKSTSSVKPLPPSNFRILRQIGDHSLLVGWSVPNKGCTIGGYQIYVDGQLHQKVRSPDRTKALLPKINVSQPVNISIYSISTSGHTSEPVSVLHPGTLSKPELPLSKKMPYMCTTEHSCVLRIRTLYGEGYDIAVQKGSNVLVCSTPDSEGFCIVQMDGQEGKLPFNLLKEVEDVSL